jgi:NAD(P)-dependent dehydrogenase (short-subunit alcohol dehydrogenase family)
MINRDFASQTIVINNADSACGKALAAYFARLGAEVVAMTEALTENESVLPEGLDSKTFSVLINAMPDISCDNEQAATVSAAEQIHSSLGATIELSQAALNVFKENGYGRVVNIIPSAAVFGARDCAVSAAAAAGLAGFARAAALDFAGSDISINTVSALLPGPAWREPGLQVLSEKAEMFAVERFAASIAYFADSRCILSGRLWSVTGARVAQCFTSTVPGHYLQSDEAEEIAQNLAAITDTNYAMIPEDHSDELLLIDV